MNSNQLFRYASIVLITYVGVIGVVEEAQDIGLVDPTVGIGVVHAQTDYTWQGQDPGQWDNNGILEDNWEGGLVNEFPVDGDTATQDDAELAWIEVDSDEHCDAFTGDGDEPDDRYVRINAQQTLTIDGDLENDDGTGDYPIRMQNGSNGNETTVIVGGNVSGIDFAGATGIGQSAGYSLIDITGTLSDSTITLGEHADITVDSTVSGVEASVTTDSDFTLGGAVTNMTLDAGENANIDVDGDVSSTQGDEWTVASHSTVNVEGDNVQDVGMTFDSTDATAAPRGTVIIGSVGASGNGTEESWEIEDGFDVTITDKAGDSGDFFMAETGPQISMHGDATMIVENDATGGDLFHPK